MTTVLIPESESALKSEGRKRAVTGWIGIDVGSQWIKVAQVDSIGGRLRLRAAELIRTLDVTSEAELDWSLLGDVVRRLRRSADFHGRDTACVLSNQTYQSERFEISDGATVRRDEIVRQLAQRMSLAESEISVDFWALPSNHISGADRKPAVQTVAMKKRLGDEFATAISRLGLSVACLDSPLTVAARCARMHKTAVTGRNIAVINWGHATATLTAVVNQTPCFHRVFRNCGLTACVEAIANRFGISPADATVLLRQYGLPALHHTTPQLRIATTLFGVLREPLRIFRDELERTVTYLHRKLGISRPDCIVLIGGGACLPGFDAWLSEDTGFPCERWSPQTTTVSRSRSASLPLFAGAMALSALCFEESLV